MYTKLMSCYNKGPLEHKLPFIIVIILNTSQLVLYNNSAWYYAWIHKKKDNRKTLRTQNTNIQIPVV